MSLSARDILLYLTLKYGNDWDKIYASIQNREDIDLSHYMTAYSSLFIISAQELISERIKNFKSDEND